MLDRGEWVREADTAAAQEWGRRHPNMFAWRHGVGLAGIVAGLVALGLGAWWLWNHAGHALARAADTERSGLPAAFWVVFAGAAVGTFIAFRPKVAVTPAATLLVKIALTVLVWLGLAVFAVAFAAT